MKRRGFLGFMGGAAASAPTLGKALSQDVAMSLGPMPSGSIGGSVGMAGPGDWKPSRIAYLKKLLSRRDPDAEQRQLREQLYSIDMRERVRLDGLRSVAPHHRVAMYQDGTRRRDDVIRKVNAESELRELLNPS